MPCPVPTEMPQGYCPCQCGAKSPPGKTYIKGHDKQLGFWERFEGDDPDECWVWTGTLNHLGYGQKRVGGKTQGTHRLAWEKVHGSIPEGLEVCHSCDTPACGNVNHLFLGTHQENMADSKAKGRNRWISHRGSANGHSKLTESQVLELREMYDKGEIPMKELGELFGVSATTACDIGKRHIWRHI